MTINRMIEDIAKKYGKNSMEYFRFVRVANLAKDRKHWIANSFIKGMYEGLMNE